MCALEQVCVCVCDQKKECMYVCVWKKVCVCACSNRVVLLLREEECIHTRPNKQKYTLFLSVCARVREEECVYPCSIKPKYTLFFSEQKIHTLPLCVCARKRGRVCIFVCLSECVCEVATISRRPTNCRSLLQNIVSFLGLFFQKRPIISRSLLIVATPYALLNSFVCMSFCGRLCTRVRVSEAENVCTCALQQVWKSLCLCVCTYVRVCLRESECFWWAKTVSSHLECALVHL